MWFASKVYIYSSSVGLYILHSGISVTLIILKSFKIILSCNISLFDKQVISISFHITWVTHSLYRLLHSKISVTVTLIILESFKIVVSCNISLFDKQVISISFHITWVTHSLYRHLKTLLPLTLMLCSLENKGIISLHKAFNCYLLSLEMAMGS